MPENQCRLIDRMPVDRLSELLGIRHELVGDGHVRSHMIPDEPHINPNGVVHGATLYAMADAGMGRALASVLDFAARCATLSTAAEYLESIVDGEIVADNSLVHLGEKVALLRSEIRGADGRLCAIIGGRYYYSVQEDNAA